MSYTVGEAVAPGTVAIYDGAEKTVFVGTRAQARAWLDEALRCEAEAGWSEHGGYRIDRVNPPGSGGQF